MAYVPLDPLDTEAGKPNKEELWDRVKDNQDDFNSRINGVEQVSKTDIFDFKTVGNVGQYIESEINSLMPTYKAPVSAQIVSFIITLLSASFSGTLEAEIDKSTDNGVNWTPLLSSPVELTSTTVGSVSGAVNWVDVPSQSFAQNDLLRIRLTATQVDQGQFHISVYGELS